jgi:phosphomannomutase
MSGPSASRTLPNHAGNDILIGGEESGGIGLSRQLPERDGIFVNLLMLIFWRRPGSPTELV